MIRPILAVGLIGVAIGGPGTHEGNNAVSSRWSGRAATVLEDDSRTANGYARDCRVCRQFINPVSHRFLGEGEDPEQGDLNATCSPLLPNENGCHEAPYGPEGCYGESHGHDECEDSEEALLDAAHAAFQNHEARSLLRVVARTTSRWFLDTENSALYLKGCDGFLLARYPVGGAFLPALAEALARPE